METVPVTNETSVTEQTTASLAALRSLARKAALTSVGAMALAYDAAKVAAADGAKLVEKAEARGEQAQQDATRQVNELENQATREAQSLQELVAARFASLARGTSSEMKRWRSSLDASTERMNETVETASPAVKTQMTQSIQQQVEYLLTKLGIPTREQVDKLSREIQSLKSRLDEHLAQTQSVTQETLPEPLADYDTLSAREIIVLVPGLTVDQLQAVRDYEAGRANRVTVLREVDDQIKLRLAVA